MTRNKPADPSVCPECGVIFEEGRWKWPALPVPSSAERELCPACRRIRDEYPAGTVTLEGGFVAAHRDEIVRLARHQEKLENGEHPLHRIMAIRHEDGGTVVTTTDIHLPRRIGEAVQNAYRGELDFHYVEEDYHLRVRWQRDE